MHIIALVFTYFSLVSWVASTIGLVFFRPKIYKHKIIRDPRLLFVLGLVFSRAVAEYSITGVLAWYFTYYGDHLVISSILSNIQSSLSSLLVIFMAHSADSYVGRFRTLLFSNTAYIGGVLIMWLFNPYDVKWLVVISLILLSLGTSGANTLDDLLEDLVKDIDQKSRDQNIEGSDQASATMLSHDENEICSQTRPVKFSHDENEIRSQSSSAKLSHDENEIRSQSSSKKLSHDENEIQYQSSSAKLSHDENEIRSQSSSTKLSHDENEIRSQSSSAKLAHDENEIRSNQANAIMLSRLAYTLGAISSILWVATDSVGGVDQSWRRSFLICAITMTTALFSFCAGHNNYRQGALIERPIVSFFRVYGGPIIKQLFNYCSCCSMKSSTQRSSSKNLETKKIAEEEDTKENDMKIIKSLSRMLPMWLMFFVVSIISATGATFFQLQYSNLNVNNEIPIQIYSIAQDFSSFATPLLYSKISCFGANEKTKKEKVRIGIGMLCGILSCIFAWRLEVYRLKKVSYLVDKDSNTSISFLWLVPQFCVLGCMEGLTRDGVLKLYKLQMGTHRQLKTYGEEYIEVVMGLGMLMNIFLVLLFNKVKGWFGDTINDSRLDKYYKFLVCVCLVNFVSYCCIAICKYKEQGLADDDQEQHNQEGMANDDHRKDNDQVWADDDQEQDN